MVDRCPSPEHLERAFDAGEAGLMAHAARCPTCGERLAELEDLRALAAGLPYPPMEADDRDAIRAALLAAPAPSAAPTRPRRWLGVAVLAAAAGLLVWVSLPEEVPLPTLAVEAPQRARVIAHGDAQLARLGPVDDEVVRLTEGRITVEVPHLGEGRFRVIAGDGVVEVHGTAFDVEVAADRLVSVRVIRGVVSVTPDGGDRVRLEGDGRWQRPAPAVAPPSAALAAPPSAALAAPATLVARVEAPRRRTHPRRPRRAAPESSASVATAEPTPAPAAPESAPPTSDAEARWLAAWQLLRTEQPAAAGAAMEALLAAHPHHVLAQDAAWWASIAWLRAADGPRARAALLRFVQRFPASVRVHEAQVRLGQSMLAAGRLGEAERWFRAALPGAVPKIEAAARAGLAQIRQRRATESP